MYCPIKNATKAYSLLEWTYPRRPLRKICCYSTKPMNNKIPQSTDRPIDLDWTGELNTSDRHRVLSSERRRVVLAVLSEQSLPMTLDELTESVATHQIEPVDTSPDTVEKIMITLHHKHLPMLSSLEVISYDSSEQQVKEAN